MRLFLSALNLICVALLLTLPLGNVQAQISNCGTVVTPDVIASAMQQLQNPQRTLDCKVERTLGVKVWVALDTLGNSGLSLNDIDDIVTTPNNAFAPIGISFSLCEVDSIVDHNFNIWDPQLDDPQAQVLYYEEGLINIYLVEVITSGAAGYAYFPGGADMIVLVKSSADGSITHEMGHFFGLFHTFETSLGAELANGSNCSTAGDLLCDTEADPDPSGQNVDATCNLTVFYRDTNGDPYDAPTDNIMSYYPCACRFTVDQYNSMCSNYVNNRFYLK